MAHMMASAASLPQREQPANQQEDDVRRDDASVQPQQTSPRSFQPTGAATYIVEAIYFVIVVATIGGWAVAGFVVWVPLLVRTTVIFAGSVFYANLFRDAARVRNAERALHFAVRFYIDGFRHFLLFYRYRHDTEAPVGLLEPLSEMRWKEMLVECLWVSAVWGATYWFVHSWLAL